MEYSILLVKRSRDREELDVFVKKGCEERYLTSCRFRMGVYKQFCRGVAISEMYDLKKSGRHSACIRFVHRMLPLLKHLEQDLDGEALREKKFSAKRSQKLRLYNRREQAAEMYLYDRYDNAMCVNY